MPGTCQMVSPLSGFPLFFFPFFFIFLILLFLLRQPPPFLARLLGLEGGRPSSSVSRRCRPTPSCRSGTRRRPPCVPCGTSRTDQQSETKRKKKIQMLRCYRSVAVSLLPNRGSFYHPLTLSINMRGSFGLNIRGVEPKRVGDDSPNQSERLIS